MLSNALPRWVIDEETGERISPRSQQVENWKEHSACKDAPVEVFFVERGTTTVDRARAICFDCPVRVDCLDYALRHYEKFGVWGGLTEGERRPFRKLFVENPEQDLKPIWQIIFDEEVE